MGAADALPAHRAASFLAEPRTAPRTTPRAEPCATPRAEPRAEPRTEPRTEPRGAPRKKKAPDPKVRERCGLTPESPPWALTWSVAVRGRLTAYCDLRKNVAQIH